MDVVVIAAKHVDVMGKLVIASYAIYMQKLELSLQKNRWSVCLYVIVISAKGLNQMQVRGFRN